MQIAKSTDFALRVLIYSASRPGELVTQTEVAEFFAISREHLRKIVHELSKAGFVNTQRGHNGGFSLAKPPSDINLADVVSLFEHKNSAIIDCDALSCVLAKNCQLRSVFDEADQAFMDTLRKYSINDITSEPMQRILLR